MDNVKAAIEYKINVGDDFFLLNNKQYELLEGILNMGSISKAAKSLNISYRTALNYIEKIESTLDVKIVSTTKGGKGGGGGTNLTDDGFSILKECKKINAIMELHNDINEFETEVASIDNSNGVMELKAHDILIKIPINKNYSVYQPIVFISFLYQFVHTCRLHRADNIYIDKN